MLFRFVNGMIVRIRRIEGMLRGKRCWMSCGGMWRCVRGVEMLLDDVEVLSVAANVSTVAAKASDVIKMWL